MRYQFRQLKDGMKLFRDRYEDVYIDDDYFAYIELLSIEEIRDDKVWIKRQHIYIYGRPSSQDQVWAIEFAGEASSDDEIVFTKEKWETSGWHAVQFYTQEEIKRRIIDYAFD